jgi:hypothetical protein
MLNTFVLDALLSYVIMYAPSLMYYSNFILSQHTQDTKLMRDIIAAVDDKESDRIQLAKQDHETEREEIRLVGCLHLSCNLALHSLHMYISLYVYVVTKT